MDSSSQAGHGEYHVNLILTSNCTCRDHEFTQARCKHIFAVEYAIEREQTADGQTVVTETVKVTRKPTRRIGPRTMPLRLKRSRSYRHCSMNFAERFLSLSSIAAGRVCRLLTLSLPARSRFTPLFQAVAFRAICRKQNDAGFSQRCLHTIQCFVIWNPKHLRLTCTS